MTQPGGSVGVGVARAPGWSGAALAVVSCASADAVLAELAERITRRLESGEPVSPDDYADEFPDHVEAIGRLMPALRQMADLGRREDDEAAAAAWAGATAGRLGDFRIVREVGRGGMGIVYEAEEVALGRRVALKVLPAAMSLDGRARQRFQLEAQATALLRHPHIVPMHAVGQIEGVPYYVMAFLEGRNLAEVLLELRRIEEDEPAADPEARVLAVALASGRPAREERPDAARGPDSSATSSGTRRSPRGRPFARAVARLGVQAAGALAYAHEQGVVHRDVKPANLMLDRSGHLWVTDFGLARIPAAGGPTQTGDLVGTLRYMSPEQALARPVPIDHRVDVYSLGATLYELLALRPAVGGDDRAAVLRRLVEEEPRPLCRLNPAVPPDLATIVARAMAKDPAARYPTARDLADDLERFLAGRPVAARPVGPAARLGRWCRRRPVVAGLTAALVAATAVGVAGISWAWRDAVGQRIRAESALGDLSREHAETLRQRAAADAARVRAQAAEGSAMAAAATTSRINRFLIEKVLIQGNTPMERPLHRISLTEVIDRAADSIPGTFPEEPAVEVEVRAALARTYHDLGEYAKSADQYRAAVARHEESAGAPEEDVRLLTCLAHSLAHLGNRTDEALRQYDAALTLARARLGDDHDVTLGLCNELANALQLAGRPAEAEALYRRVLAALAARPGGDPEKELSVLPDLAHALQLQHKDAEAEVLLRRAVDEHRRRDGLKAPRALSALNALGVFLQKHGQLEEAEAVFRESLEGTRAVHGDAHPATLVVRYNLAIVLRGHDRAAEAEPILREILDRSADSPNADARFVLDVRQSLALVLRGLGRRDEARQQLARCLEDRIRVQGPDDPHTRATRLLLEQLDAPIAAAESPSGRDPEE